MTDGRHSRVTPSSSRTSRRGAPSALARAISIVENRRAGCDASCSAALHPLLGRARRIGITGPPGAGKSTLTTRLAEHYRKRGLTVGIIAVDPTSPFTGGALLGDRIRMESVALDAGIFIRSMATRGSLGGLAAATRDVCDVLDAFGFDRILVETVGVGQSELDVARTADTSVLVIVPESGDSIQTLKAGLMEVADLFVVNKADRPGADRMRHEMKLMLGLRMGQLARNVPAHHGVDLAHVSKRGARRARGSATERDRVAWTPPVLRDERRAWRGDRRARDGARPRTSIILRRAARCVATPAARLRDRVVEGVDRAAARPHLERSRARGTARGRCCRMSRTDARRRSRVARSSSRQVATLLSHSRSTNSESEVA